MIDFINKLLELEDSKLAEFEIEGYKIWPLVRYKLFGGLIMKKFSFQPPHARFQKLSVKDLLRYIYLTAVKWPWFVERKEILFLVPSLSNMLDHSSGKYVNRLSDYYAEIFKDETVILEFSSRGIYKTPRYFENTYFIDMLRIIPMIVRSLKFGHIPERSKRVVEKFLKYISHIFQNDIDESIIDSLRIRLISIISTLKIYESLYKRIFEKFSPKIIFVNAASYGDLEALIVKWAKDMGITTAEIQHGLIYRGHMAYNYNPKIWDWYEEYLPDYLLLHGEFWKSAIRSPSEKIIVGNAYLIKKWRENLSKRRISSPERLNLLIISQGIVTKKLVDLTKYLAEYLGDSVNIIYKLHPGEVPFKARYKELYSYENVEVLEDENIYDLISTSNIVIGVSSTALFEALIFRKPVLVWENSIIKDLHDSDKIFRFFREPAEVAEIILKGDFSMPDDAFISRVWNENWEIAFENFIRRFVS